MSEQISDLEKRAKLRVLLLDELENFVSGLENDGLPKREINASLTIHAAMYMRRSNEVREGYKKWPSSSSSAKPNPVDLEPIFRKLISIAKEGRLEKGMIIYQLLFFAFQLIEPDWKKVIEAAEKYRR